METDYKDNNKINRSCQSKYQFNRIFKFNFLAHMASAENYIFEHIYENMPNLLIDENYPQ